ncbi:LysR family transcriptional regulator [Reyranella sp. CPCC 100927]|nr:LysR family transcriptional regulator [Reyranella sp. CPCC 100927]
MEPSWEHYRSFLTVLRHGSLSAAARTLKLTQPTIGRHIDELEQTLRLALFTRSRQGLAPTDAAIELRPHAEVMEAAAGALVRAASGAADQARGVVRLTASEIIGSEVLPTILAAFRERHPEIVVELMLSNRTEDLLKREADIAVRMVRPVQAALVTRHLGHVTLGLHAHRRYLELHGRPQTMDELARHALIGFDRESPVVRHLQELGFTLTRDLFALRTDNDLAQLAAIRAGFGIGVCQVGIARRDVDLVHLLPDQFAFPLGIWIAMHGNLRASRRTRLMFDHLVAGLSDYIASGRLRRRR